MSDKTKPVDMAGIMKEVKPEDRRRIIAKVRKSTEESFRIPSSESFYKEINAPKQSPLYDSFEELKDKDYKHKGFETPATILEFGEGNNSWRWKKIQSTKGLMEATIKSEANFKNFTKIREAQIRARRETYLKRLKGKEDFFNGGGSVYSSANAGAFPVKQEYSPLLGTPFFKQMYLYDYLLSHSKCFYFKNYSGLAKNIIGNIRNFVIGRGFSVTIDKKAVKAQKAWDEYVDRSNIEVEIRNWTDELTTFGEVFLKKVFTSSGIVHRSVDPSTIWEIVTDPENITDVKYYHQQYSTQYQLYGDKNTPLSKYIIQQIPPDLMRHYKVNVTSYEKRGRSDLLSALLYLKYYEDYTAFKLLRVKNEAAFMWDVTVDGDAGDVQSYIDQTQGMDNVPPGSENVHNKAVTREPMTPAFSHAGSDDVMKWIISYVCASVNVPATYLGMMETSGGGTRAGALVATEPVIRMFDERRTFVERMCNDIFDDVMMDAGIDPTTIQREFNFPEFVNEDRTKKIQDLITAKDEKVITHKRMSELTAKELNVNNYQYDEEQEDIQEELAANPQIDTPLVDPQATNLTPGDQAAQNGAQTQPPAQDDRSFDRSSVRQQSKII